MPRGLGSIGLGDPVFKYGLGFGSGGGGASFTPAGLAAGQYWLNPYDEASMSLRNVAQLATGGNYLARTGTGSGDPFHFQNDGTTTIFNLSAWFYLPTSPPNNTAIIAKTQIAGTTTDNGVWALRLGGVSNAALQLLVWTTGTASGLQQITFTISGGVPLERLNHVVISYNGALFGDDTAVLKLWLNGVQQATPAAAGLPRKFQNPSTLNTPLTIGNNLGTSGAIRISDVVLDGSRVWSGSDVTALWNTRRGISGQAALTTAGFTGLTADWRMTESSSATRADDSGNGRDLAVVGTVPAVQNVVSWTDAISGAVFVPYALGANSTQGGRSGEGIYSATMRNGKPGVKVLPWNFYYVADSFTNQGGHIWVKTYLDATPSAEVLMALYADDITDTVLKYCGIINQQGGNINGLGQGAIDLIIRARIASNPNGEINNLNAAYAASGAIPVGNTGIPVGADVYMEVANIHDGSTGVGGTAANPNGPYRLAINGVDQAAYVADGGGGTLTDFWCDNPATLSNFTVNGLARLGPSTPGKWQIDEGCRQTLGDVVTSDAGESAQMRTNMNTFLAAR